MSSTDLHEFSSDRPIETVEDDLLGRDRFSKDLADALASWHGKDSLVVGLHGEWGSGKSSIKNMAISELKKRTIKPEIVEFTPWEWAAQEKITASFFQEISASIGYRDKSKNGKNLASSLRKYGRYLNTGESLVTGFSNALPTLFVLAVISGVGKNFTDDIWVKHVTNALLGLTVVWAAVLKWGSSFLSSIAGGIDETAKELSLSQLRSELKNLLSARKNPLLVVMDDLDRLTSVQLRMVFQLVKANAEFPNVVFLLIFQRDLVEEKLNDGKQTGRDYLEKIIQVPFDIPKIEISRLHELLFKNLDRILEKDKTAVEMFDSGYWGNVFHGSLSSYFDTLRNVYRFSSTLSFHFSLLRGRNAFEVNPVDLIAIECLRLFEPDVYKEIARSKDIFTKSGWNSHNSSKDATTLFINGVIEKATGGKKEAVTSLINLLFPTIECVLGGSSYGSGFSDGWLREMRICHASNFEKYFQFSIPSDEISNSDLHEMLQLTSNSSSFKDFIFSLHERGILKNALGQFESYIDRIPLDNAEPFIKALLDLGDMVDHETIGFSMLSPYTHIVRLVSRFLRRNKSLEYRGQILLKCFKESKSIATVKYLLHADENRREKADSDQFLADKEFSELKDEFVRKLDEMAINSPDDLMNHEHLISILYCWKRWGNEKEVCSWLTEQTKDANDCIRFLRAFVFKCSSSGMGDHVVKITKHIKLQNIEDFLPVEYIQQHINSIDIESLDADSKEALKAFAEAVDQREKGITNDW